MKIELKKFGETKKLPNDSVSIDIESKFIDLEIDRRDRLQTLVDSNYNKRKYCEEIFSMFDVTFDDDYSDVAEFMNAKKGILSTNIPAFQVVTNSFGCKIVELTSVTRLSYEVIYHDVNLNCCYSLSEVESLVKNGKIILLRIAKEQRTKEIDTEKVDKVLPTLEKYDFNNLDKNGIDNNELVFGMVRSTYDVPVLRTILSTINERLVDSLNNLRTESVNMRDTLIERASEHERFANICDEKIKRMGEKK